jgi:anti-sigma B factor antagonist
VLSVHPERVKDVYRLTISGELDLATRDTLRAELERAEAGEARRLVLDLCDLTFIGSTGIALLVEAHQRLVADGTRFRVLLSVDGQVREVLELTGLTEVLDFTD